MVEVCVCVCVCVDVWCAVLTFRPHIYMHARRCVGGI